MTEVALNSSLSLQWLFGDLGVDGFRLSIWRGRTARLQRLDQEIHRTTPVLALSLAGTTELCWHEMLYSLKAEQAMLLNEQARLSWSATGGHRLLVLEIKRDLMKSIGGNLPLRGNFAQFFQSCSAEVVAPFTASQSVLSLAQALVHPPSHQVSLPVWYRAKVLELAALLFYSPAESDEQAAPRPQIRQAQLLVQRAAFLLERDLENPPSLEMLAQELSCSAFQLSRYFAAHMDSTMPEFLRRKRMERAAALLHTTDLAVSEIALAVGYTSFSAFTRAFVREQRVTPTAFRQIRSVIGEGVLEQVGS